MARKGNRQNNGLDRNTSNHKQTGAESMVTSLSDKKEMKKGHDRKPVGGDRATGDPQCRPTSPYGEKVNNMKNMVNKGRYTQKGYASCGKKSEDKTSNISNSVDISSQVGDTANELLSDNSEPGTDGVPIEDVMDNHRPSDAVEGRNFRSLSLHMLEVAKEWIEQLPQLKAFMDVMTNAHNYVLVKVEEAYPVILTWVLQFGNLMFFLAMVWLDCGVRGLDSLLRLGTTSFLTVVWCSTLSVIAMIGVTKMIVIMVIVGLFVVFTGFVVGCVILALCAAVILWLYGSFWTTGLVTFLGGAALALRHDRVALFITALYSMYCARSYVGWLGLLLGLNLSFISSDILVYIVKNKINDHESSGHSEQARQRQGRAGHFPGEPFHSSPLENDRSSGVPSTSGAETELTSEEEVVRLLNCNDHYSALGLNRFDNIDVSYLKKEYRKKAMLVHPDKNMGNEKAVEAFKKLQNAYEVLLDSLKRKTYDDELRSEELFNFLRRFQSPPQKNGRRGGVHRSGFSQSEAEDESSHAESRRIACKKCGDFHIWIRTERSKSRARWCQDCKDFHQAKDGDGWLEQSFQPLLFGLLQKRDPPCVYVCAESRIYDATEWFICQGMRCPPNTHKPSFQVNTSIASKHSSGSKGAGPSNRGGSGGNGTSATDMNDAMTEEELFEWLQNAVQSGMFEASSPAGESPTFRTGSSSRSGPKKRKGKKQW